MKHWTMRTRLMLMYVFFAILPTVILFGVYLYSFAARMEDEVAQTMMQTLKQAALNIENDLETMGRVSDYLFAYDTVNVPLSTEADSQTVQQQVEELKLLRKALQATLESSNISGVRLYVDDRKIYARERENFYPISDFYKTPSFTDATVQGNYQLTETGGMDGGPEKVLSYVRLLKDMRQVGRTVGALVVDLDKSRLDEVLNKMDFPQNCLVYLTDDTGRVLAGAAGEESLRGPWREDGFQPAEEEIDRVGDRVYLIKGIEAAGWFLVAELPADNLSSSGMTGSANLILYLVVLMVFIGLVLVISSLIVNGVALRVQQLATVFGSMGSGKEADREQRAQRRSFFGIFRSLDDSLGSARSLIRASYEQMEQQRSTQLQLLQAQINPHFLYNTLDTIQWMVRAGKKEESVAIISSLTRYFRLILNNGRDVVTVGDEVAMTKAHIEIQRMRFGNTFDVEFIIEPDVYECLLPKMTLQPVIENALLHGIRPLSGRRGRIDVDIYRDEEYLTIAVTDNGVGMSVETRDHLLGFRGSKEGGYGLYNVNQRILLFSGTDASGITIESEEGKYTTVTLRIAADGGQEAGRKAGL